MDKRKASLLSIVLLSIFAVLTFMPITFLDYFAAPTYGGAYVIKKDRFTNLNFYVANIRVFAIILLLVVLAAIVALLMIYIGKKDKYSKFGLYLPIVATVLFLVICVYEFNHIAPQGEIGVWPKGDRGYFGIRPLWGFYIEMALLIASSVISGLIISNKILDERIETYTNYIGRQSDLLKGEMPLRTTKPTASVMKSEAAVGISAASEIREYKQLYDDGIISREEFEAKKQQLLGLPFAVIKEKETEERAAAYEQARESNYISRPFAASADDKETTSVIKEEIAEAVDGRSLIEEDNTTDSIDVLKETIEDVSEKESVTNSNIIEASNDQGTSLDDNNSSKKDRSWFNLKFIIAILVLISLPIILFLLGNRLNVL